MSPRRSAPPRPKRVADAPPPEHDQAGPADDEPETEADTPAPALGERIALDPDEPPYEQRPRHSRGDDVPQLGNDELARVFYEIGDMLEIQGEVPFKVGAYHRAAESIAHSPLDVARAYRDGSPPRLPGVGKAIDEKLAELADTGRLRYYERLRRNVPPSVVTLLQVPGLGPRTAGGLWRGAGIDSLEALEAAARAGRLRQLKGISARTEQRLLEGLANLRRRPPHRMRLGTAADIVERVVRGLSDTPDVGRIEPAGSFRRRRETVADIDILVETDQPAAVIEQLHNSAWVEQVGGHGGRTGAHRTTVQLLRGPQVDLMAMPAGSTGTYLVHFTGSAEHNVRLRAMARDKGWSLSEHGLVRLGDDGEPLRGQQSERLTFATEEEVYAFLGLPFIPPELREDRGEIEAGLAGRLPAPVELDDLQGDCHTHSEWSDGHYSIERMAREAISRGLRWQVLTDHSQSLTIARGLTPERVEQQRRIISKLNQSFAREGTDFRLLHGCEMEIRIDGRLDYDDALLARFDVVVASLHVGRRQPRSQLMERYRVALRNRHVDIIAHPSGRKIGLRDDLDLEWDAFYREAAETGTLLELNGSDERLDLDDRRARAALEAGNRFVVDSDAHYLHEFENLGWGVSQARRAWLEKKDVMNALPVEQFLALIADRG
ncbi:MAG TPA: DNA polymerase/3'-5' exonuclease PolX [Candidatus Limnocylindria bacterium]|nr:DNA polymerase/3'-5' exonuclease PolX [Candidatus Limnocylindria bacterium]